MQQHHHLCWLWQGPGCFWMLFGQQLGWPRGVGGTGLARGPCAPCPYWPLTPPAPAPIPLCPPPASPSASIARYPLGYPTAPIPCGEPWGALLPAGAQGSPPKADPWEGAPPQPSRWDAPVFPQQPPMKAHLMALLNDLEHFQPLKVLHIHAHVIRY